MGIEVWTSMPIESGDFEYDNDTQPPLRCRDAVYLGYADVGSEWELAVKEVVLETRQDDYRREYEEAANPRIRSLISASRRLRTAATGELPRLLDQLKSRAEELIKTIDAAKKAAESL